MFRVTLHCLVWIVVQQCVQISCIGDSITLKLCSKTKYTSYISCGGSSNHSQNCAQLAWSPVKILCFVVIRVKTIIMWCSPCLWSWSTSLNRNSVDTSVKAVLNITEFISLSYLCHLCSAFACIIGSSQSLKFCVKCFLLQNSMIWEVLPVLYCSILVISISKSVYKKHTSIYLMCRCGGHITNSCTLKS